MDFHRISLTINSQSFIKWIDGEQMIHELKGRNNKDSKNQMA